MAPEDRQPAHDERRGLPLDESGRLKELPDGEGYVRRTPPKGASEKWFEKVKGKSVSSQVNVCC